jgi:hypothetical protein
MKKRKMSALQRKYFGKKHKRLRTARVVHHRRKRVMAKHRYYSRAKGIVGGIGGKGLIVPIIGGVADNVLDRYIPLPIDGIGATAVGIFMKSPVVRDIGLYKVGFSLGNMIPLPGAGSASSGGWL